MRSLLLKLDAWVADDVLPAAERLSHARGRLPRPALAAAFSRYPGRRRSRRAERAAAPRVRAELRRNGIATIEPPRVGEPFPVLLPQVDADGNEIAGLRSPELAVPLATYTGWQLYKPELGRDDELVSLQGSFVPFPLDAAERAAHRRSAPLDPRALCGSRALSRARRANGAAADRGRLSARRRSPAHRRASRRALARARRAARAALEPAANADARSCGPAAARRP